MKYGFSSKFKVEAKNTVEAWDKFLEYFVLDLGLDFASVSKLAKTFKMKEGVRKKKKQSRSSAKFKKPFDFRIKWK